MASGVLTARGNCKLFKLLEIVRPCACGNVIVTKKPNKQNRGNRLLHSLSYSQKHLRKQHLWGSSLGQQIALSKYSTIQTNKQQQQDPYKLVEDDLATLSGDIHKELTLGPLRLQEAAKYHFDGRGKAFRPMVVLLTARACNAHNGSIGSILLPGQRSIAVITEMLHTASLVHDDVIDISETRRGKPSVYRVWGQRKAALTGDFILAAASMALARIRNEEVVRILSWVLEDLVRGEFMQLGSKEDEAERFNHYMKKTFKKTASLIAHSCKAVAVLGNCADNIKEIAYEYGKNIGIAFQLVDDLLDFTSSDTMMGKPTAADLRLGLATAPVLFAAEEHEELNPLIMRRFSEPGDVEKARSLVAKSSGIAHTRYLAEEHCKEAIRQIHQLNASVERDALITITHQVLNRLK